MSSVIICDAPTRQRSLLVERLAQLPSVAGVAVVDDPSLLAGELQRVRYDLVLLTSQPPDHSVAAAVRLVRRAAPGARVLILTLGTDPDDIVSGIAAGAVGYLARDAAVAEVAAALALLPPPRTGSAQRPGRPQRAAADLTDREMQVLEGMSRGLSNGQIGDGLFLSEDTIKTHARRLFRKMEVNDRAHAVAEGFRRGLLL